jgi:drug/metabolite transporter (DMT)-like permease
VVWLNIGSEMKLSIVGAACVLAAPIAWAWGSIWSRGKDLPEPFMSSATQMLCGSVMALVVGPGGGRAHPRPAAARAHARDALPGGRRQHPGFTAYVWLLHHVRPALATSYAYVNPPIAMAFGALLGGERFDHHAIGAMVVILAGVLIITQSKARVLPDPSRAESPTQSRSGRPLPGAPSAWRGHRAREQVQGLRSRSYSAMRAKPRSRCDN